MMEHNQLTLRTYMAIMAERDAAIQERNMSLEERKRAFAERDMAMLQRDAAIAERNSAIQERDEAIVALRLLESSMDQKAMALDTATQGEHNYIMAEAADSPEGNLTSEADTFSFAEAASETAKPRKMRLLKDSKVTKSAKSRRVENRVAEGPGRPVCAGSLSDWDNGHDMSDDEQDKQPDRRKDNLNPNWIVFDESAMPTPVCTCTGSPQPCYRWGNGGWQSACCTTTISMYPLPQVSNKRYTRVGGRKMSGSAFSKLLNRLASEGHDLSIPLDLKDHWAKHGTNRYTTVK